MARRTPRKARAGPVIVRISSRAESDLLAIRDFIARNNPENAERFLHKLLSAIDGLERMPARHPRAPERVRTGGDLRQAIVGNYRIVFEIASGEVHVHTVRHAARHPADDL